MTRTDLVIFFTFVATSLISWLYLAFAFGHDLGLAANMQATRDEAFSQGVTAGKDWEDNKHSLYWQREDI